MNTYEIEIKSLLGSEENALALKSKIVASNKGFDLSSKHKQLNHYFDTPKDLGLLAQIIDPMLEEDQRVPFKKIITEGKKVSIRTRDADNQIIFVIKASIDDDTSTHAISRMEFEIITKFKNVDELDKLLLDAGLTYQAKWSRQREEYKGGDVSICIDKNAGYGYLAEFEKIGTSAEEAELIKNELQELMQEFGVVELPQERLERMFAYYNANWPQYYGTNKIFTIE